jgi:hypothetical protein
LHEQSARESFFSLVPFSNARFVKMLENLIAVLGARRGFASLNSRCVGKRAARGRDSDLAVTLLWPPARRRLFGLLDRFS